jgi:hypothetical protein
MDQKTGIRSSYGEFCRGYGADLGLFRADFRLNSTYQHDCASKR